MNETLDTFNREWYEMKSRKEKNEELEDVPDIYLQNQRLEQELKSLRIQAQDAQEAAAKAQGTWNKFRKERDFHRMHHKRVAQEKKKLIFEGTVGQSTEALGRLTEDDLRFLFA